MYNIKKIKKKNITTLINSIHLFREYHSPKNKIYKLLKQKFIKYFNDKFKKGYIKMRFFNFSIFFPYIKMGTINSTHLFGIDEIILFNYYYKNRHKYKKVCDIGANTGLHSIILKKCGFKVDAFEPDLEHFKLAKKNFSRNKIKINIVNSAVSNFSGQIQFTRILNNSTGSYIGNKKKSYGPVKKYKVSVISSKKLKNKYDLIKVDAEGSEGDILKNFNKRDFKNTDIVLEISTPKSKKKIWSIIKKNNLNVFSQKNSWRLVKNKADLPSSHREGSVIISKEFTI